MTREQEIEDLAERRLRAIRDGIWTEGNMADALWSLLGPTEEETNTAVEAIRKRDPQLVDYFDHPQIPSS